MKPRLFIGCSTEQLRIARVLARLLAPCAETTVCDRAGFPLGKSILDGLIKAVWKHDFAVFVFGEDDCLTIRAATAPVVRDNVVFELGLFIGSLGSARAFWLRPHISRLR